MCTRRISDVLVQTTSSYKYRLIFTSYLSGVLDDYFRHGIDITLSNTLAPTTIAG